jgi:pilus assembly protein CpaB
MLVLAVIALILSGGVTYLAYRLIQGRLQPVSQTIQIVVAAEKLPLGTRITEKLVTMSPWPKSIPLVGSFTDPAQVRDRGVIVEMQPNEPVLETKLAPKEAGAGLAVAIPEGMRAISIQVNAISGVTGFVQPGSRVDLILTTNPPKSLTQGGQGGKKSSIIKNIKGSPEDQTGSKIILENLQVLAVGQNVQQNVEGKPQSVQEVTLLVTPEEASKIALATGDGRIQLALRHPLDQATVDSPLVYRSALYEGPNAEAAPKGVDKPEPKTKAPAARVTRVLPPPLPPPVVAPAPRVVAVELIQGPKRATETFQEKKP